MRAATWLTVIGICASLAGCGGTSPKQAKAPATHAQPGPTAREAPPTRPGAPLSKFESSANRLCADAGGKITVLPPLSKGNFLSQVSYEQGLIRRLVADLNVLRPPAAKRRGFEKFLSETAAQPRIIDRAIAALRARRASRASALLKQLGTRGDAADRAAASIGLTDCARDYTPVPHPTA